MTFLGVSTIVYGIACFLQGDFAVFWQPVPDSLPFRQPLSYVSAVLLIIGGAGLLIARTIRPAAMMLLVLFALYDACYLLKLVGPPFSPGALLGLAEQSSVVVGGWAILLRMRASGPAAATTARVAFGICSILFGVAHILEVQGTARLVPEWMPGGQVFWAFATGVAHLAVGLSLIANRLAVPTTRIGALMYVCFALLVWLPGAVTHPTEWLRWAGGGISLCMAAALWLVGDLLSSRDAEI
ncbi:MAG: hypothetical protein ABI810_09360 [Sphingomonas bacterium]